MSNPFEEEIEADYHQALLETGNLPHFKSGSHKWTGKDCWLAEGFAARVHAQCCTGCKSVAFQLIGIFRIESNAARKASRFVALRKDEPLPTPGEFPHPVEISHEILDTCPGCLEKHGFPNINSVFSQLGL